MSAVKKKPPLIARIGQQIITVVAGVLFFIAAFMWVWSGLMLSLYFIAVWFLVMLLCLWAWTHKAFAIKYMAFTIVGLIALLAARGIGERQLQTRFDSLKADVAATGVEGLDPFEKVVLWQTNVVMAGAWAASGDPWTAGSMVLMNIPSDGSRTLPAFLKPAPGCPPYHETSASKGRFDYRSGGPATLHLPVIGISLTLDMSLLHVTEQAGWLHPYNVTWGG